MSKPFSLLTGDDGVNAEGLILVKRIVEKFADFAIVATKDQQSGVGGKVTLKGGKWGKTEIDGVEAIWVDGTPADAVYFAFSVLKRKPEFVISGMNYGENLMNAMYHSGTIAAALIAANAKKVPAIAFSLKMEKEQWLRLHDGRFNSELLKYPGNLIEKVIKTALEVGIQPNTFWNVNLPPSPTRTIKVVKSLYEIYFPNEPEAIGDDFKYKFAVNDDGWPEDTDAAQLYKNHATLTPCRLDYNNMDELDKLKEMKVFG